MRKGHYDAAREVLIQKVRVIHDIDDLRVTVVFDGAGQRPEIERQPESPDFTVIYAPSDSTADTLIERLVANSKNPERVTVASQDFMIRETVQTLGAFTMHPEDLEKWVERCLQRQRQKLDVGNSRGKPNWGKMGDYF